MRAAVTAAWLLSSMAMMMSCSGPETEKPDERTMDNCRTYYVGFLTRGETWTPEDTDETRELQKEHLANIKRLADSGVLALAGPFITDDNSHVIRGLFFFDVETIQEARQLSDTDPAVQAGRLAVDVVAFEAPSKLKYDEPVEMTIYQSALFMRGPNWSPEAGPSFETVLEYHRRRLREAGDSGKVILAGRFVDSPEDNPVDVLIIARADSLAQWQQLVAEMPAVANGVLVPTVMNWYGPAGLRHETDGN